MRFSQRIGKAPVQETIQLDTMTDSFKNRLFNYIIKASEHISFRVEDHFYMQYANHFGLEYNNFRYDNFIDNIKSKTNENIYFLYDFIEFLVNYYEPPMRTKLIVDLNYVFELEKSAYRFGDDGLLVAITDQVELDEVNETINNVSPYSGVEEHLSNARSFFSNRENPNYNKTISESIDAIESICKIISKNDKATLGEALKDIKIHPALKESLKKLYGFASDEGGIRHANKKKSNPISEHEAKLILVISHSIINYLIANNLNGGK
jgi:hypothetical protein